MWEIGRGEVEKHGFGIKTSSLSNLAWYFHVFAKFIGNFKSDDGVSPF